MVVDGVDGVVVGGGHLAAAALAAACRCGANQPGAGRVPLGFGVSTPHQH